MFRSVVKCIVVVLIVSVISPKVLATHIVGGELNYKFLGNNNYEIRLTVLRDCYNGVPDFDDTAHVGLFNINNALVGELFMKYRGKDTINPYIISPCLTPPVDVCYEVTTYIDTIHLNPMAGGYQLAYQRCCRNITIQNILNPSDVGITIYAHIPDQTLYPVNSNPVFINLAPPFICASAPFVWNQSAIDLDGDSVSYEMCTPLDGASSGNPMPDPPNPPPYANVQWQTPYSLGNIMGGVPMAIDPITGILTATPSNLGQYVVGVCANEWRNGVKISTTKRDFQINVVPCPTLVLANINVASVICGYKSVTFQNNSFNASSY